MLHIDKINNKLTENASDDPKYLMIGYIVGNRVCPSILKYSFAVRTLNELGYSPILNPLENGLC